MVALCSRALEGVGATMAPNSQLEKGSCADLVKAAKDRQARTRALPCSAA